MSHLLVFEKAGVYKRNYYQFLSYIQLDICEVQIVRQIGNIKFYSPHFSKTIKGSLPVCGTLSFLHLNG